MAKTPYDLMAQFREGRIDRRAFIRRGVALGISASAIAGFLAACGGTPTATTAPVASAAPSSAAASAASSASASAAPASAAASAGASAASGAGATATRPAAASGTPTSGGATPTASSGGGLGTASKGPLGAGGGVGPGPTKRGGGGTLKILYWQAPTILNPHLVQGTKDSDICRVIYEPLADFAPDDTLVPFLAESIPSIENGMLAKDGTSVTWKLRKGVKWSDGVDFNAKDVLFTYKYATDPKTATVTLKNFDSIKTIEAPDDFTVKLTFKEPTPGWYVPFVGLYGMILPEHIFKDGIGESAQNFAANLKPIGTGPYKLTTFSPGDSALMEPNPAWRDANGPFYDRVEWKGGGDATSAARAVFQTGDYDLAWNLQVEAATLNQLAGSGAKGKLDFQNGFGVERIYFNLADPNKETDGERASIKNPHPFFSDKAVRKAFTLAVDRKTMSDTLYGPAGEPTAAFFNSPASLVNPNLTWEYSIAKANQALDATGWAKSGQYRAKGGAQMKALFQTTVNTLRQKEQQLVKDGLEQIGCQVELKSVDSGVFFSSDPGNNDTGAKFYADLEMFTTNPETPDPQAFFAGFSSDQIPNKENRWGLLNYPRYQSPAYDKLVGQSKAEMDPAKRKDLFFQQQQLLFDDAVYIGLVSRRGPFAVKPDLQGIQQTAYSLTWNIANWLRKA